MSSKKTDENKNPTIGQNFKELLTLKESTPENKNINQRY